MHLALDHAIERARETGAFTLTLRRCQHVACLAATLLPAVAARMVALMMVSSPNEAFVSPFGGSGRLFSNNPLAFTAPGTLTASGDQPPLLFDVSMAITAGSQVDRAGRLGRKLPEAAIKTASGAVSDDPAEFRRGGAVMPIGGLSHGHKGHALTLMTEVLTQALAGHGRARSQSENEQNNVFLQVLDPLAFADAKDYDREIEHLQRMVEDSPADDPERPVRLPGRRAWASRLAQMAHGIDLDPGTMEALAPYAEDAGLDLP
jgi:L-lactate dehydrogenase